MSSVQNSSPGTTSTIAMGPQAASQRFGALPDTLREKIGSIHAFVLEEQRKISLESDTGEYAQRLNQLRAVTGEFEDHCLEIFERFVSIRNEADRIIAPGQSERGVSSLYRELEEHAVVRMRAEASFRKEIIEHQWKLCSDFIAQVGEIMTHLSQRRPPQGSKRLFFHNIVYHAARYAVIGVPEIPPNRMILPALQALGININSTNEKGLLPLVWAIKKGDIHVAKLIHELQSDGSGFDPSRRKGKTLSHYAVISDEPAVLELAYKVGDEERRDEKERTPLVLAILKGKVKSATFFYLKEPDPKPKVDMICWACWGVNFAHCAVLSDSQEILDLVQSWTKDGLNSFKDPYGEPKLFLYALEEGNRRSAAWLQAKGANTDFYNDPRVRNNLGMVRILVIAGCLIRKKYENGNTPLARAIIAGDPELAQELCNNGAMDINFRNAGGQTYLHLAVYSGNEKVQTLVMGCFNGDIDTRFEAHRDLLNHREETTEFSALTLALIQSSTIVACWLLDYDDAEFDADEIERHFNDLQVFKNLLFGSQVLVEKLISKGFTFQMLDEDGNTLLARAIIEGDLSLIQKMLIVFGMDVCFSNSKRQTYLHLAFRTSHSQVRQIVFEHYKKQLDVRIETQRQTINQKEMGTNHSPLTIALLQSDYPIIRWLLGINAEFDHPALTTFFSDHQNLSKFVYVARDIVETLSKRDFVFNWIFTINNQQISLLSRAISSIERDDPQCSAVMFLCSKCTEAHPSYGTVLHQALVEHDKFIKANGNPSVEKIQTLHNLVRVLVYWKPELLNQRNAEGMTPLFLAVQLGFMNTAEILHSRRASLEGCDNNRNTIFHLAVKGGVGALQWLEDKEFICDVNATNVDGKTPIELAQGSVEKLAAAKRLAWKKTPYTTGFRVMLGMRT